MRAFRNTQDPLPLPPPRALSPTPLGVSYTFDTSTLGSHSLGWNPYATAASPTPGMIHPLSPQPQPQLLQHPGATAGGWQLPTGLSFPPPLQQSYAPAGVGVGGAMAQPPHPPPPPPPPPVAVHRVPLRKPTMTKRQATATATAAAVAARQDEEYLKQQQLLNRMQQQQQQLQMQQQQLQMQLQHHNQQLHQQRHRQQQERYLQIRPLPEPHRKRDKGKSPLYRRERSPTRRNRSPSPPARKSSQPARFRNHLDDNDAYRRNRNGLIVDDDGLRRITTFSAHTNMNELAAMMAQGRQNSEDNSWITVTEGRALSPLVQQHLAVPAAGEQHQARPQEAAGQQQPTTMAQGQPVRISQEPQPNKKSNTRRWLLGRNSNRCENKSSRRETREENNNSNNKTGKVGHVTFHPCDRTSSPMRHRTPREEEMRVQQVIKQVAVPKSSSNRGVGSKTDASHRRWFRPSASGSSTSPQRQKRTTKTASCHDDELLEVGSSEDGNRRNQNGTIKKSPTKPESTVVRRHRLATNGIAKQKQVRSREQRRHKGNQNKRERERRRDDHDDREDDQSSEYNKRENRRSRARPRQGGYYDDEREESFSTPADNVMIAVLDGLVDLFSDQTKGGLLPTARSKRTGIHGAQGQLPVSLIDIPDQTTQASGLTTRVLKFPGIRCGDGVMVCQTPTCHGECATRDKFTSPYDDEDDDKDSMLLQGEREVGHAKVKKSSSKEELKRSFSNRSVESCHEVYNTRNGNGAHRGTTTHPSLDESSISDTATGYSRRESVADAIATIELIRPATTMQESGLGSLFGSLASEEDDAIIPPNLSRVIALNKNSISGISVSSAGNSTSSL